MYGVLSMDMGVWHVLLDDIGGGREMTNDNILQGER
jgi:hypothetical protein